MKIQVTKEDILKAGPGSYCCPIALAVQRITGQNCSVSDRSAFVYNYTTNSKGIRIKLPEEASVFVRRFDTNVVVDPFEFELDL